MVITISAAYGTNGASIGREVARRLDIPFLDRAVPAAVAERLGLSLEEALEREETVDPVFSRLPWLMLDVSAGPVLGTELLGSNDFRVEMERVVRELAATGSGVILGRTAWLLLGDDPHVLRVRLDGPPERRLALAQAETGASRKDAERQMKAMDRAREEYARHFYKVDPRDPSQYHMVLDATAYSIEACAELVIAGARALEATAP